MPLPKNIFSLNELGGRKNNEDSVWPPLGRSLPHNPLFLVCDGVGGNSHGEVASEMACRYIAEYFNQNLVSESLLSEGFVNEARKYAMKFFSTYIEENPDAEKMSTTLTLAYLKQKSIFLAWCGDSKIFHIRQGKILFQSEDHSLVNELLKRGDITPEEAAVHPHRNVITRSLQLREPYSAIQTHELHDIQEDDYLLLCTDGVTEKVTPEALNSILFDVQDNQIIPRFQEYCEGKTRDNYSMYLVKLSQIAEQAKVPQVKVETEKGKPKMLSLVILLILLLAVGALYVNYRHLLP